MNKLSKENVIKDTLKQLIEYAQEMLDSYDYERPVDITINKEDIDCIKGLLKLYDDKKEEIYSIAKTNYTVGVLEERSQWYKKINEKIEELKRENDKLEEKKTFRITDKELIAEVENNEAVTDLLNYKIRLAIIGILEEIIGKEE